MDVAPLLGASAVEDLKVVLAIQRTGRSLSILTQVVHAGFGSPSGAC